MRCRDADPKRVYYMSMEFLMGRSLTNALYNLGVQGQYAEAVRELGYDLETLVDQVSVGEKGLWKRGGGPSLISAAEEAPATYPVASRLASSTGQLWGSSRSYPEIPRWQVSLASVTPSGPCCLSGMVAVLMMGSRSCCPIALQLS